MRFYFTNPPNFFLVIFYHDQITAILVTENDIKYARKVHHSPNDRWKLTILPLWPDRTEMLINYQKKAQLLIMIEVLRCWWFLQCKVNSIRKVRQHKLSPTSITNIDEADISVKTSTDLEHYLDRTNKKQPSYWSWFLLTRILKVLLNLQASLKILSVLRPKHLG